MTILPFRPGATVRPPTTGAPDRAEALQRVLAHAVAVFIDAVPASVDVDAGDADEVRAAVLRYAPQASDAIEEALFHHGAPAFGARVMQARVAR